MDPGRQPGYTTLVRPRPRPPPRSDGPPVLHRNSGTTRTPPLPRPYPASELRQLRQRFRDARGVADGLVRSSSRISDLARSVGNPAKSTLNVPENADTSYRKHNKVAGH